MRAQLSQGSEKGLGPRSASHAEFRGKESGYHPHSGGSLVDEARIDGAQLQSEHNHHLEGQRTPLDASNHLERTAYHAPTNSYLPVTATGPLNTVGATNRLAGSMALSRDYDYVVQNKKPNPFYKTTAQDYCPKWQLTQDSSIKDYTVPTFDELLRQRQTFFKMEKTLKNEFTNRNAKAQKDLFESKLTEYDKMKLKFDRNAVVAKEFPFKPEEFKQPKPAINVGNELYMTSNMDYGRLAPSAYEISTRWFPNNNTFTREMPGGPYTNQSLKTAVTRNRVHDYLDGFN